MKKIFLEWVKNPKTKMDQGSWVVSGDTGISSKTMWAAINGYQALHEDKPYDPADLGRCIRYVENTGVTAEQLFKVKEQYNWWAPYIDNWQKLVDLYNSEKTLHSMPMTYDYLQELKEESDQLKYN